MVTPETPVLTINGVGCTVQDILATIGDNSAFQSAVRMKALERMVAERDAQLAASEVSSGETPSSTPEETPKQAGSSKAPKAKGSQKTEVVD